MSTVRNAQTSRSGSCPGLSRGVLMSEPTEAVVPAVFIVATSVRGGGFPAT